mmetsp:Transcript_28463/g.21270  ORF Transcript_28463/g.21270 Transcript_28463/m.21270 type:complete len:98 (+) Transcript_28463:276-569(+)
MKVRFMESERYQSLKSKKEQRALKLKQNQGHYHLDMLKEFEEVNKLQLSQVEKALEDFSSLKQDRDLKDQALEQQVDFIRSQNQLLMEVVEQSLQQL